MIEDGNGTHFIQKIEEKLVEPKDSKSREVKTAKSKTREKEVTPYSKWVKTLKNL